jgi:hypothetical protein
MSFSAVLGASSAIRAGVVTSSTRPSAPYNGQLIYETDTARLAAYNGSAWVTQNGLQLITAQTIGSAVSSVTVSNCFSATYDNYMIVISGGVSSAATHMTMQLGSTTTGYYFSGTNAQYGGASIGIGTISNGSSWYVGRNTSSALSTTIALSMPNLASRTTYTATYADTQTSGYVYTIGGFLDNSTQYTAFTIAPTSGTYTGGVIRVYGYANN